MTSIVDAGKAWFWLPGRPVLMLKEGTEGGGACREDHHCLEGRVRGPAGRHELPLWAAASR